VNQLRDNTNTIKKVTDTIIDASKEVGLEVNTEKTKYMLLSRHQNTGHNHDMKTANRSLKNGTVKIFENDSNNSKFDQGRN
jgi:hypothetical protein